MARPDGADQAEALRVTHVSLYKNGVGFFEHTGQVTGDATVRLDLSSAQLNDVLQTLTAVDLGGGRIAGANYNSTAPLGQQLGNLPFSLGEDPDQDTLYSALRGARVEVTGAGGVFTGRVLAMEVRPSLATDGKDAKPVSERRVLTVVADSGATRTLELGPNVTVRLLDTGLRNDLSGYLALMDRNRVEGIRHVTLTDHGTGTRELRVSYLSEVPVWKSTYRLLLTSGANAGPAQQTTVQGFSVVDNTTGEDWDGVQLSLIAGSPQSFVQPLAQPVYDRRPEVPIAESGQLTPQTHESAVNGFAGTASAEMRSTPDRQPASLFGSPTGSGMGIAPDVVVGQGAGGNMGGGVMALRNGGPMAAPRPPAPYEEIARQTVAVNATTTAFDDFFAYTLADPVTIPRNGSALVPTLQERMPVENVTLWSASAPRPLRALWLTNSSGLTLDRGSFSVVENGAFAGEGLLDPLHPGERRLLSYAADDAVRVTPEGRNETHHVTSFSVSKGVLRVANTKVAEVRYTVSDAAPEARTVVVEEPRRAGWTLEDGDKPSEEASAVYRYRVAVPAHGSAMLRVRQRRVVDVYFQLASATEEMLTVYLRDNMADPALMAKLEPVFDAKRRVAEKDDQLRAVEAKIAVVTADQSRVRENLGALKGSAEERALVRRYTAELNAQEDTLAELRKQRDALETQQRAAQAVLSQRIEALQVSAGA